MITLAIIAFVIIVVALVFIILGALSELIIYPLLDICFVVILVVIIKKLVSKK